MDKPRQRTIVCLLALTLTLLGPGSATAGDLDLTLRINDAMATPGERVAVVLRTYAPRGVGQGQICRAAQANRGPGAGPRLDLEEVVVFSEQDDATVVETFDGTAQTAVIEFASPSATINWADGPLAVLFFRLDASLQPGQEFELMLDLADTFLVDAFDQSIPLELRGGVLTVRDPGAPYELAAEGDEILPGDVAALGVDTSELFPIGSGQVALRWDPAVAAGPPVVSMDPRHGDASFSVDLSEPGRALVSFSSPDGSLNEVAGKIIGVDLPTAAGAPAVASALTLDPVLTFLEDPGDSPIPIALVADVLDLRGPIFADGFESGDLDEWTAAVP